MPLQPGPFQLQPDDAAGFTAGVYNFEADAVVLSNQLHGIDLGWNELVAGIDALAADPLADLADIDTVGILTAVDTGSGATALGSLTDVTASYTVADGQLTDALNFAPTSAYADPPTPFVPPPNVLNIYAPTVDASAFDPATASPVGPTGGTHRPDVELENLTRFGAQNFTVGDSFKLLVLGFEGQVVTVAATKSGQVLGTGNLGTIDYSGNLAVTGTMGPDFVGAWVYAVYLDGVLQKTFHFVVTA